MAWFGGEVARRSWIDAWRDVSSEARLDAVRVVIVMDIVEGSFAPANTPITLPLLIDPALGLKTSGVLLRVRVSVSPIWNNHYYIHARFKNKITKSTMNYQSFVASWQRFDNFVGNTIRNVSSHCQVELAKQRQSYFVFQICKLTLECKK